MSKAAGFGVQLGEMDLKEGLAWVSMVWWGFITTVAALGTATTYVSRRQTVGLFYGMMDSGIEGTFS